MEMVQQKKGNMKRVQHEKSATSSDRNMKEHEKGCNMERVQHVKRCNMKRVHCKKRATRKKVQHEKSAT